MTPIATIHQMPDGSIRIVSSLREPLDLARVLAALLPDMLRQVVAAPAPAMVVDPAIDAAIGEPAPVLGETAPDGEQPQA